MPVLTFNLAIDTPIAVGSHLALTLLGTEAFEIVEAFAWAEDGPVGADLVFDINVDGVSIWATTQSNRVTIADGANEATPVTAFDNTTIGKNANVTIDCDQIGSTIAGQYITVELHVEPSAPKLYGDLDLNGHELVGDTKQITLYVFGWSESVATGDGKAYWRVPSDVAGKDIVNVAAQVGNAQSSSGTPTVQIARLRAATAGGSRTAADVLSTELTIDVSEWDSKDATTPAVIDTDNDDMAEGDLLRIDVDVAGTGTQGLFVAIGFK